MIRKLLPWLSLALRPLIGIRNRRVFDRFSGQSPEAKALVTVHFDALKDPTVEVSELTPQIEAARAEYGRRDEPLVDGSLGDAPPWDEGITIAKACQASRTPRHAAYLYHLIRLRRPKKVLELGTNLGISGAYIAAALKEHGGGRLITMDASPYRQRLAKQMFDKIGLANADFILGDFTDTFDNAVQEHGPFDFSFIDGNHQFEATQHYAQEVSRLADPDVWVLFDDIRWSDGMAKAWQHLKTNPRMVAGLDLYRWSLCIMAKEETTTSSISDPVYSALAS